MQEPASVDPEFRALFERAAGCCLVLGADLTICAVSDGYARAAMISRAGLLGRSIFDLVPEDPQDPEGGEAGALRRSLEQVLAAKRPDAMAPQKHAAPRPLAAGGGFEERYWSALNAPILDEEGEVRWIVHSVTDVTELVALRAEVARQETLIDEQQRAAERLHATNRLLARRLDEVGQRQGVREQALTQHANAEKLAAMGAIAGTIAHDFNNLLGIILGNLEMLCEQREGAPGLELAQEAQSAAARGVALARRLLAFGRRQSLEPARLELNNLLAALGRRLGRELGPDILVTLDLAPALWPVVADATELEGAILHLVANARDAMELGGRLIIGARNGHLDADYVAEHPGLRAGDYVLIEVSDTGSGMTHEVARRAFEPFFTTKEARLGSGLGLSAVMGFTTQSGGHVEIASEAGIGTTVRLYLPRLGADAMASAAATPSAATKEDTGGGETVLVVEDDAAMRRVVLRQLYELGYRVLEAEKPSTALRLLETERVDLLFTDIVTPGSIDGIALARTAAARWPSLKILLTSGFPQARRDGRVELNGFRLLSKPYKRDELARTLREVLDGADPAAHAAALHPD